MKTEYLFLFFLFPVSPDCMAQNAIYGPMGVYEPQYNAATTIFSGGSVKVGNGGNWYLAGNITGNDKGNTNAPNATGRSEKITFDGSGTYSNAMLIPGAAGNVINGYAAASNQANAFTLPVGNSTMAYPVTIPSGANISSAYFDGSGTNDSSTISGSSFSDAVEFSPYYDMPEGTVAGNYTLSYPSGFTNKGNQELVESGNSSSSGTTESTTYAFLASTGPYSDTASSLSAILPAVSATQVYFATSAPVPLPVTLISFTGTLKACEAQLSWKVAAETDVISYIVEKSRDGMQYEAVKEIAARKMPGTHVYGSIYSLMQEGAIYFRLKINEGGRFSYSPTVRIFAPESCSAAATLKLSPVPAANVLHVEGALRDSELRIHSITGKLIRVFKMTGSGQDLEITTLASGIYIVKATIANGALISAKFIKK